MAERKYLKLNIIDYSILASCIVAALGLGLAKAGYAGVDQKIQGTPKVNIEVFITGLKTKDPSLFKPGEKASITIRNQPVHPPMTIVKCDHWQKQISFLAPDGKKAVAFPDPANSIAHDFLVTVQDDSEKTEDGYVIRGNKIKVGNQIELEAFKYRVQGVVVDIFAQPISLPTLLPFS